MEHTISAALFILSTLVLRDISDEELISVAVRFPATVALLFIVVVPVAAPIDITVAAPPMFNVVAIVLAMKNVVESV